MAVRVGDPSLHRPATPLVEQAFRSFAEDRAEERELLGATPEAATCELAAGKDDRAKSAARRRA